MAVYVWSAFLAVHVGFVNFGRLPPLSGLIDAPRWRRTSLPHGGDTTPHRPKFIAVGGALAAAAALALMLLCYGERR